jgi:seryl-tRNA synthetase
MFDLKLLQKSPELVRDALNRRGSSLDIDRFFDTDARRRKALTEVEGLKSERNKASAEVAKLKRAGEDAAPRLEELGRIAERIKQLDLEASDLSQQVQDWLLTIPNVPHESVPLGKDENDNPVVSVWGEKPALDFTPVEHWDLGVRLGGLDFERAGKISGARFAVYWDWAARMERALAAFMLDVHCQENGYLEVAPPAIVNRESMTGTGQLPKFAEDLFRLEGRELYLIPTAEVPVTNLHRDEVLSEETLPVAYAAHTPCFRSEAGSYGKDTRGLIRMHQFNKVELVRFAHPDRSYEELETLRGHAESILRKLGLHYRVIVLCTGDMGFGSAKTYDLEVWLPGQQKYREISSCTNFEAFQARRANIRFKPAGGKKSEYAHTLNGSGLAIGRTLVAILENYQQADGSVLVPEALRPYMGGLARIQAKS